MTESSGSGDRFGKHAGSGTMCNYTTVLTPCVCSEQSAVTALDFMVEQMTATPLSDAQRSELSELCQQVVEEPTKRGFRVKLII